MSKKSLILVIIQFVCFAFFALAGNLFVANNYWLLFQILGIVIGVWGVLTMKMGNFNIQPEVKHHAKMVTSGPYKIIRNPMYTGLLLFFGISVFLNFNLDSLVYSIIRIVVFIILFVIFVLKINMEEKFLAIKFGTVYAAYKQKTYKIVPYLF